MINAPRLFYIAFNMVKPFMNERIRNSIFFHDSLETLHKEVPKEILPKELGMILNKMSIITIFGHQHLSKNMIFFTKKFQRPLILVHIWN